MEDEGKREIKIRKSGPVGTGKIIFPAIMVLVVVGLVGFGGWSYWSYRQAKKEVVRLSSIEGQQELAHKELESLLVSLSRHMILPEGEEPTVATVTDAEALKSDQPFFDKAQNGDKLVVYSGAKKAIIYSPERDVVVNVGALVLDEGSPEVAGTSIEEEETQQDELESEGVGDGGEGEGE